MGIDFIILPCSWRHENKISPFLNWYSITKGYSCNGIINKQQKGNVKKPETYEKILQSKEKRISPPQKKSKEETS